MKLVNENSCFGFFLQIAIFLTFFGSADRFYYADERTMAGLPVMRDIDGLAAGKVYLELANSPEQRHWQYTFTKDGVYKDFGDRDYLMVRQGEGLELVKRGRD